MRHLITAHDTNPDAFSDHEQTLVDAIEPLGIFDTARAVTYWRQAVNGPSFERDAESLHGQRRIHLSRTFEGLGRIDGWLDPEGLEMSSWRSMRPRLPRPKATIERQLSGEPMRLWTWPARLLIRATFQQMEASSPT